MRKKRKKQYLPKYQQKLGPGSGGPAPMFPATRLNGVRPGGTRIAYWSPDLPGLYPQDDLEDIIEAAFPEVLPVLKLTFEIDIEAEREHMHEEDRIEDLTELREFIKSEIAGEMKDDAALEVTIPGGATFFIKPNVEVHG